MKQNTILIAVIVAIVFGGAGYYAGTKLGSSGRRGNFAQFGNGQGGTFFRNGASGTNGANRGNFRPVIGQIISADTQSITVKLPDGSSKIVLLTGSTQISKAQTASKSDLTSGTNVAVFGTENSDGSVTAQNIQLNPQLEMRRGAQATPSSGQ